MKIKTKVGARGQFVIPKVIRESLGIVDNSDILIEVKDKSMEIRPLTEDIAAKWEKIARQEKADMKKIVYGDKLYEEEFK